MASVAKTISSNGLTENAGHEIAGDMKLTNHVTGHENAGHENDGPISRA